MISSLLNEEMKIFYSLRLFDFQKIWKYFGVKLFISTDLIPFKVMIAIKYYYHWKACFNAFHLIYNLCTVSVVECLILSIEWSMYGVFLKKRHFLRTGKS